MYTYAIIKNGREVENLNEGVYATEAEAREAANGDLDLCCPSGDPLRKFYRIEIRTARVVSKHTPGPWKFRRVHSIEGRPATALLLETSAPNQPMNDPCVIAVREDWIDWLLNVPKGQANARLIAAAPDLLEACKAALTAVETTMDRLSSPNWDAGNRLLRQLESAIAKAEGGAK